MRAISSLEVFLCSKAKICDLCCEVNCQYVLLLSALGGGLGRPRRLGIPSPEGERRMTNAHLKVLHFDLESSHTHCKSVAIGLAKHIEQALELFGTGDDGTNRDDVLPES